MVLNVAAGTRVLRKVAGQPDNFPGLILASLKLLLQPACRLQVNLVDAVHALPHILRLGAFQTHMSIESYASEHSQHRRTQAMDSTQGLSMSNLQRFLSFFRKAFNAVIEAPGFQLKHAVSLLGGLKDAFFLIMSTLQSAKKQLHASFHVKYVLNGPALVCLEVLPAIFRVTTVGLQSGLSDLVKSLDQDFISEVR